MASLALQLKDRRASAASSASSSGARDPRAAPVSTKRNVSIPETCEFYGVKDAISHCRVPRSCADCLAKPGCFITGIGVCTNASDAYYNLAESDHRNATFGNDSAVSTALYYTFLAGTATLCPATDSVCTKCRAQFMELSKTAESSRDIYSQFCRGENGCVCIAMCEVPAVRAWSVIDGQCGQPPQPRRFLDLPARQSFTSPKRDPRASLVNVHERRRSEETCKYHFDEDVRGCRRPRTCQECLLKQDCVISNFQCESIEKYYPSADYRNAQLGILGNSSRMYSQFPSTNTTYCPASDEVCQVCREKFKQHATLKYGFQVLQYNSEFCMGSDGCVCIEACESDTWTTGVYDTECNRLLKDVDVSATASIAVALVVWTLLASVYRYSKRHLVPPTRRQVQQAGARILRHMLDEVPALGRLDLFGWRAYQERLNYQERRLLDGYDVSLAVTHPVDFECMDPSAPDFEVDNSSAPTAYDPKALASAPQFRSSFHDGEDATEASSSSRSDDFSTPSAPDFEEDAEPEMQRIDQPNQGEEDGLTRRARRSTQEAHR